jgi:hypothetical protein
MNEVQEIDVERIMERIRENIRRRRSAGDIPAPERDSSTFLHGQVATDFACLHSGYDINDVPFVSHRRILGSLVLATKKAIRKLLAPILDRQVAYNAASTRVATYLKDWIEAQGQISDRLRKDVAAPPNHAYHASVRPSPPKLRSTRRCSRAKPPWVRSSARSLGRFKT